MQRSSLKFSDGELVECGIDYLTLTSTTAEEAHSLTTKAYGLSLEIAREGNMEKPWSMMGYKGFKVGGLQWGEREDGVIVRLSGSAAFWNWWDFYQECQHATRVDIQVTVRVAQPTNRVVLHHLKQCRKFWGTRKDGPRLTHIHDNDGGATLYIGCRQSEYFFRCYAKDVESKLAHYKDCVRYEGEFKDGAARRLLDQLSSEHTGNLAMAEGLVAMLRVRGCWPLLAIDGWEVATSPKNSTDVSRKLEWVAQSVRPSVRFLISHVSIDSVIDCLGITPIEVIDLAERLKTRLTKGQSQNG